jgi:hypothetical protein
MRGFIVGRVSARENSVRANRRFTQAVAGTNNAPAPDTEKGECQETFIVTLKLFSVQITPELNM